MGLFLSIMGSGIPFSMVIGSMRVLSKAIPSPFSFLLLLLLLSSTRIGSFGSPNVSPFDWLECSRRRAEGASHRRRRRPLHMKTALNNGWCSVLLRFFRVIILLGDDVPCTTQDASLACFTLAGMRPAPTQYGGVSCLRCRGGWH